METSVIKQQRGLIFSNFILKLLAFFFMTLDHLGLFIGYYFLKENAALVLVMHGLGRLAMPLFAFLIYEGAIHTKNFRNYALRLGGMAAIIAIAYSMLLYIPNNPFYVPNLRLFGNIFMDLFLGAVGVFLLKNKDIKIKLLSLIPVIISILSFGVSSYEKTTGTAIHWFPPVLRTQYGCFAVLMIMGFYIAKIFKDMYLQKLAGDMGVDAEVLHYSSFDVRVTNLVNMGTVIFFAIVVYIVDLIIITPFLPYQWLSLFSGALLLCYNGKRGYNRKWFEYGAYFYYPLHIAILAVLFYLLTL